MKLKASIWATVFVVAFEASLLGAEPTHNAALEAAVEKIGRGFELLGHYKDVPTRAIFGEGRPTKIKAVAFSGENLAAVTRGGDVCVWDRTTSKLTRTFSHFQLPETKGVAQHGIAKACFSEGGKLVCMDDCFFHVALWDVVSGKVIAKHDEGREMVVVCAIAISPDCKQIALAGFDDTENNEEEGIVALWNPNAKVVRTIRPKNQERACAVDFQPKGHLLAVNCLEKKSSDSRYSLWNVETARLEKELPYKGFGENRIQFDGTGRYLVGVTNLPDRERGGSMVLRCWDVKNNKLHRDVEWGEPFSFSPNSLKMVACRNFPQLTLIDLMGGSDRFLVKFKEEELPTATCFSADGKLLLVGTDLGNVYLFRIREVSQEPPVERKKAAKEQNGR